MKIYEIEDSYINYLKTFDKFVLNSYGENYKRSRKYLGTIFEVNGYSYFIPFSSPDLKDDFVDGKIRKSTDVIIRMKKIDKFGKEKLLGTLRINSMIPILDFKVLKEYNFENEKDYRYKDLVLDELRFININKEKIIKTAKKIYRLKTNNKKISYLKSTVDFSLLEDKVKDYKTNI